MCGICGTTEASDDSAIRRMNAAMVARGPDDEGTYVDPGGGVALGARRLSVIDVEGGHQPVRNEDGTVWAVLNGEIYNHPALQERLRRRGHRLRSRTDTEVLVHLYEEHGDTLVHALEGMYAFAVWDSRRRRLLMARDRFGEKPLFYSERPNGGLLFASDLSALSASGQVSDELDPDSVDRFFVFGYVPGPASILREAQALPPGHVLTWTEDAGARVAPYWSPPENRGTGEPFGQLVAETIHHLERSVGSRMIADVPLGVFLSGGLDSTLIAALAARASSQPVKTFTIGYDVGDVSETAPARRVARQLGSDHHELILTEVEASARAESVLASVDQPLADPALTALNAVAELARNEVTVIVGGEGADELFAGYPRYRWLERAATLERLLPRAAARAAARTLERVPLDGRAKRLATVVAPGDMLDRHTAWVTAGRLAVRATCYGSRLADQRGSDLHSWYPDEAKRVNTVADVMRLDQRHWLPHDVLTKADRAGMLVSLEIRTPYLQRELAEFAASVPTSVHMSHGGKALLRAALASTLPGAEARPKTAFRVPAGEWLRGSLGPIVGDLVAGGRAFTEGWFEREAVARLAREQASGSRDWSNVLWPVLAFALWLERLRGRD